MNLASRWIPVRVWLDASGMYVSYDGRPTHALHVGSLTPTSTWRMAVGGYSSRGLTYVRGISLFGYHWPPSPPSPPARPPLPGLQQINLTDTSVAKRFGGVSSCSSGDEGCLETSVGQCGYVVLEQPVVNDFDMTSSSIWAAPTTTPCAAHPARGGPRPLESSK